MKRMLLSLIIVGCAILLSAQSKKDFVLLRNPGDINLSRDSAEKIRNIRRLYKTNSVLVIMPDRKKKVLEDKIVWGFIDRKGVVYRNYQNDFFEVRERRDLILYTRNSKGFRGRNIVTYYFSKDLSSPLLLLDKYNLLQQYKNNLCFLEKLKSEFRWPYDYARWDNKSSSYKINELLKVCRL